MEQEIIPQDNLNYMYTKMNHAKFQWDFQEVQWDARGEITQNSKITISGELKSLCNFSCELSSY